MELGRAETSTSENPSHRGAIVPGTVRTLSDDAPDQLLTVGQLAAYLNVPVQRIYDWRWRGEGPPAFKVGASLRYRLSEVETWLEEQREPAE